MLFITVANMICHALNGFEIGKHVDSQILFQVLIDADKNYTKEEYFQILALMKEKKLIQVCSGGHLILTEEGRKCAGEIQKNLSALQGK
jgi:hypothetical protein